MTGKVAVRFYYEDDGAEKAENWQREEESEIDVHGWTPQDREPILHATYIGEMLLRVPAVVCDGPHS
jgi:hypothetical protein